MVNPNTAPTTVAITTTKTKISHFVTLNNCINITKLLEYTAVDQNYEN